MIRILTARKTHNLTDIVLLPKMCQLNQVMRTDEKEKEKEKDKEKEKEKKTQMRDILSAISLHSLKKKKDVMRDNERLEELSQIKGD